MLRLQPGQWDTLWDVLLPLELHILPPDLAGLDQLLDDPRLLAPFRAHWDRQRAELERDTARYGRPTIAMATYLRLMTIKHRTGWGYEKLMSAVSDSFQLRRFCRISLGERVPDESTVRKLTRRLGPEVVEELIRGTITIAVAERRFRPRAMRCDSTVVGADIRFPTDIGLAADAVRVLARAGRAVRTALPESARRVRDRTRAVGKRVRALGRRLSRRTGEAAAAVRRLTEEAAGQVRISVREAKALLAEAQQHCSADTSSPRKAQIRAMQQLEDVISLAERVMEQIRQRFAGEKITNRLVSLFDPDARPVRRGKLARPNEFGYVVQLAEVTSHTRKGARGLLLPAPLQAGSAHENTLLVQTVNELGQLGIAPKEAAFDAGFGVVATAAALAPLQTTLFITASPNNPTSVHTRRRLARYRVGCEGRISHLKREYSAGRPRLKGTRGAQIWQGWAILAYDLDTVANLPRG